jgi:quercetin dioxygenase-like cupin family protein
MPHALREPALVEFGGKDARPTTIEGVNFAISQLAGENGARLAFHSDGETIFIAPDCSISLEQAGRQAQAKARSVAIAPPGATSLAFHGKGRVFALTSKNADGATDPRVAAVGTPFAREGDALAIAVFAIDEMPFPPGNPRLKFLQSATMSINWVEYDGPRDRRKLSPHAHKQFEQGSLAIAGSFVHHIRTPWTEDAGAWRDDLHIAAGAGSVLVIPPELVHTTEGIGPEKHILIDVFAPVRRDFIAKGWVHNAAAYRDPEPGKAPLA